MHIDETYTLLIFKNLTDEITSEEQDTLNKWLNADSENADLFNTYKKTWELSNKAADMPALNIDLDAEWQIQEKRIGKSSPNINPAVKIRLIFRYAAAAAVLIIGAALFFLFKNSDVTLTAENRILNTQLPDKSRAVLYSESELSYSETFNEKDRTLEFKGEAFFEVSPDKSKPFVIKTERFTVEVVGTKFYVNTQNSGEVIVQEGTVAVYKPDDKNAKLLLEAGERAEFTNKTPRPEKSENQNPNYISWLTKVFVYHNATLEQVAKDLEKAYDITVKFENEAVKKCPYNNPGGFHNEDLDMILKIIDETLPQITIQKTGNSVLITGAGC